MNSLRFMLLGSILLSTCLAWGLAAYFSHADMKHEVNELFDAHLAESAQSLLQQARLEGHGKGEQAVEYEDDDDDDDDHDDDDHDDHDADPTRLSALKERGRLFERRILFQLWDASGRLIFNSDRDLPEMPLVPISTEGFTQSATTGSDLRVFSLWNKDRSLHMQVAESLQTREKLVQSTMWNVLTPVMFMIMPLLIILVLAVEYALRTLRRLSKELQRRTPDDLSPIHELGTPQEVRPILKALNGLFVRLHRALENERRFTADAAHELRTPLAAVKIQAQVALRSQQDDARQRALDGVIKGVDRATHLVEQLLTMARLDPETELKGETVALRALIVDIVGRLAPDALAKGLELTVHEGSEWQVQGNPAMLEILVRNLVDNAIRYTPGQGYVHIYLEHRDGSIELRVEDSGPGLTDEQKKHVLGRFSRVIRNQGYGSGFGLSIVERIAAIHKAQLILESGPQGRGLRVRLTFHDSLG